MKICVITLQNVINYGSVLQTYATKHIIERMGYDVIFIDYIRNNQTEEHRRKEDRLTFSYKNAAKYLYRKCFGDVLVKKRTKEVFQGFISKHIPLTSMKYYSVDDIRSNVPQADIYCTGSDQMWNSGWNDGIEHSYYLDFVSDKPKFSFSTSIGMNEFPNSEVIEIVELLNKYNFITVRETSAVELLKKNCIESEYVLDPTLMVDCHFWSSFSERTVKKYESQKYILLYQLNLSHDNVNLVSYVRFLSEEMHMPVKVIAYGITHRKHFDEYIFMPTMEEYVSLIKNAEYVVTDSFHGTSFCINLNRQFTVVYPHKYATRIENILELCNLQDRVLSAQYGDIHQRAIDYSGVNKVMDTLRRDSIEKIEQGLSTICSVTSIKRSNAL